MESAVTVLLMDLLTLVNVLGTIVANVDVLMGCTVLKTGLATTADSAYRSNRAVDERIL